MSDGLDASPLAQKQFGVLQTLLSGILTDRMALACASISTLIVSGAAMAKLFNLHSEREARCEGPTADKALARLV